MIPASGFVIGGGKPGFMYLLDRATMTLRQQFTASTNQYDPARRDDTWNMGPHLHGSPAYWRGPDDRFGNLYVWGEKDFLRRYRFDTLAGKIDPSSTNGPVLALKSTMPGGMLSILVEWQPCRHRHRLGDAARSVHARWAPIRDACMHSTRRPCNRSGTRRFPRWGTGSGPTIADGKVFVGTSSNVIICYELAPEPGQANGTWKPYQPHELSMTMKPMRGVQWDEAPMTTIPVNTLRALAPPDDVFRYAVLAGAGTAYFAAQKDAWSRKPAWELRETRIEAPLQIADRSPIDDGTRITVSVSPDFKWKASDGSTADARPAKSYAAPDDDGPPWELYKLSNAPAAAACSTGSSSCSAS